MVFFFIRPVIFTIFSLRRGIIFDSRIINILVSNLKMYKESYLRTQHHLRCILSERTKYHACPAGPRTNINFHHNVPIIIPSTWLLAFLYLHVLRLHVVVLTRKKRKFALSRGCFCCCDNSQYWRFDVLKYTVLTNCWSFRERILPTGTMSEDQYRFTIVYDDSRGYCHWWLLQLYTTWIIHVEDVRYLTN